MIRSPSAIVRGALSRMLIARLRSCSYSSMPLTGRGRLINAATVNELIQSNQSEVKFIDVRTQERYTEGHIPEAANIHTFFTFLATSDKQGVQELKGTFETLLQDAGINGSDNEHVVTYEDSLRTLYGASCRALYVLKLLGHPRVSVLNGGYEGWVEQGLPTTTKAPQVFKGSFQAGWEPEIWSGKDEIANVLEDQSAVLLDVRDPEEWTGMSSSPYGVDFAPRKGRLPGAVHILWKDLMEKRGDGLIHFKNRDEIRKMCAAKGVTPDKKIIVYCFKGARASNTFIALKDAGFDNVTNYFASWNEWSRDDSLSIDSEQY